ncbi:MAG: DUF1345 domain-containing protein [Burkholderiaceae bacterium]
MNLRHSPVLRLFFVRPRLALSMLAGIAMYFLAPQQLVADGATRILVSWNVAVCLYLVFAGTMMANASGVTIRERALEQDEGSRMLLLLVVLTALAMLLAIVVELSAVRALAPQARQGRILLGALTVMTSWAFTHLMFALHYAHDYYLSLERKQPPGMQFPGDNAPDYGDFLYLSGVIGTSGQTADVAFTSSAMRRVALVHCVLAFFFNTTVLALVINIAASLLQG